MLKSLKYRNILSQDEKKDTNTCKRNFPGVYDLYRKAQNDSSKSYQKVNSSIGGRKLQLSPRGLSRKDAKRKILYTMV